MSPQRFAFLVCFLVTGSLWNSWDRSSAARALAAQDAPDVDARLARAQAQAAKKVYEGHWARLKGTIGPPTFDYATLEFLCRWSRRWRDAEIACDKATDKQVAACSAHLDRMKKLDAFCEKAVKSSVIAPYEAQIVLYHRIEAERGLAAAKKKR